MIQIILESTVKQYVQAFVDVSIHLLVEQRVLLHLRYTDP